MKTPIKINSHACIPKTYHEGKPLPIGTFSHVHFSDKLKPHRIGPYYILDRLSDVTYELFHKTALLYMFIKITKSLIIQTNHFCTHICVVPRASQNQPNLTFQNQLNMQIVIHPLLSPMNLFLMKIHNKHLLHHELHPITISKFLLQMTAHLSNYITTHPSK